MKTQPNQIKPNLTNLGVFDPFFGQNPWCLPLVIWKNIFPKLHLCVVHFSLVPLLDKFITVRYASDYMCRAWMGHENVEPFDSDITTVWKVPQQADISLALLLIY